MKKILVGFALILCILSVKAGFDVTLQKFEKPSLSNNTLLALKVIIHRLITKAEIHEEFDQHTLQEVEEAQALHIHLMQARYSEFYEIPAAKNAKAEEMAYKLTNYVNVLQTK